MLVYRFKISFVDYEDVSREIEIKSIQTFADFHKCIQESIHFDGSQPASFYMSNDHWTKGDEITSHPKKNKDGNDVKLMKDSRLCDFIADPHQKIYYIFDLNTLWTFHIELVKIIPVEHAQTKYPLCVKSIGDAPKQYGIVAPIPDPEDFELLSEDVDEPLIAEKEEDLIDDEEIAVVADDDEEAVDPDALEEEGEEEV